MIIITVTQVVLLGVFDSKKVELFIPL